MQEENNHIATSEIEKDIADTQKEIDNYNDELTVLTRSPQENKVRIYFLEGKILKRESFIQKLRDILTVREGGKL